MSYQAFVTKIKNVRKHSNADRLQLGECFTNTVVVGLDIKEWDLGIYFPTDGKLGEEFAVENNLVRKKDEEGNNIGGFLDPKKRNIRALNLRGEKSDGLFLPLEALSNFVDISTLKEGDSITVLGGKTICEKYIPQRKKRGAVGGTVGDNQDKLGHKYPFFRRHKDTEQLAYNLNSFRDGDDCIITLKMHGTSQRTSYAMENIKKELGVANRNGNRHRRIRKKQRETNRALRNRPATKRMRKEQSEIIKGWGLISGTRRTILEEYRETGGFHDGDLFREEHHKQFIGKLHKGETVYYEVVGYAGQTTIMPSANNKKTQDKEFIQKYGEITNFTYGCEPGESKIYIYRMTITNEDGYEVEYPWELVKLRAEQMAIPTTPQLDAFKYTTEEDLIARMEKYEDGEDPIGKTHVREGIVVRIERPNQFMAFKHKNYNFKVLEGIIKDSGTIDMEEDQGIEGEDS